MTSSGDSSPTRTRPRSVLCTMFWSATLTATGKPNLSARRDASSGIAGEAAHGIRP